MKRVFISVIIILAFVLNNLEVRSQSLYDQEGDNSNAINNLEVVGIELYAIYKKDGTYPKNIVSGEELKNILGKNISSRITTDGSPGSLIAIATNAVGSEYRIYTIGRDINHCYGQSKERVIVGPDTLENLVALLGEPLPENTKIGKIEKGKVAVLKTIYGMNIAMRNYVANNNWKGGYPKNITSVEALKNVLDNNFPSNIKTDGSPGSLIAFETDSDGHEFRLCSIGKDENNCYGFSNMRRILIGPDTLANIKAKLGPFYFSKKITAEEIKSNNKRNKIKWEELRALEKIGDKQAIEAIIVLLKDEFAGVRSSAAQALIEIGDNSAVEALIDALRDKDRLVRVYSAQALGNIGDKRAIQPLTVLLKDISQEVRLSAANALSKLADSSAVEALIYALEDLSQYVRAISANALGNIGDKRAIEPLMIAINDKESNVRVASFEALAKIGVPNPVEFLIAGLRKKDDGMKYRAKEALSKIGKPAVELLILELKNEDKSTKYYVMDILGDLRDERAIEPLIAEMKNKDKRIQMSAAGALFKIGKPSIESIIPLLKDNDSNVQKIAALILKEFGWTPNNTNAEIKQGSNIYTKEISFHKDDKTGIFSISLNASDLQGNSPKSISVIYEGDNLFNIYCIDGKDKAMGENQKNVLLESFPEYKKKKEETERLSNERSHLREIYSNQIGYRNSLSNKEDQNKINEKLEEMDKQMDSIHKNYLEKMNELWELERKILNEAISCTIYGRFNNQGEVILKINDNNSGKNILSIKFNLPEIETDNKPLLKLWLEAQETNLKRLSSVAGGESIFSYILNQTIPHIFLKRDEKRSDRLPRQNSNTNTPQKVDMYSITTGALAIQESLQLDRMTGRTGIKSDDEVPIEKLVGPQIKSHPFSEMLKDRKAKPLPIAALVPEEFYYFHFSDINKEIEFSDLLDQWGTSLLNVMQVSSHDAQLKQKYLRQLCLELSVLTRLFGDKVIDDLAIMGNDPFLHEGTDVSVVFNVKNKKLFDINVSKYFTEAKKAFPDAVESDITYGQFTIHSLVNSDRKVSSYSCYLNDFKVYSNSQKAIELIIDTYEKKHPSLVNASDFQYMRTVFPADKSQEDAFLYLSESCIRKLVGAQWKIARKRRIECNNSLGIINNAITMYYMEKNTKPPLLEDLLGDHYIESEYLLCPDGGNYAIDEKIGEPFCNKHGRLRYLTPIVELQLPMVSKAEQEEYGKFVEEYNKYWSRFFDPIGIKAKFDNNKIKVETCILPLIENSIYNGFKVLAGGNPVEINSPEAIGTIFQLFTKLNLTEETLKEYKTDLLVRGTSFTPKQFLDIIGDNFSINAIDNNPMLSFDLAQGGSLLSGFLRDQTQIFAASFALSAITMPTYITISVKNEEKASQFIHELIQSWVKENAYARMDKKSGWFNVYGYQVLPDYKGHKIETLVLDLFVLKMRLYFTVYKNYLIIANQRNILTGIIDDSGKIAKAKTNLMVRISPEAFDKMSEAAGIGWQERMRKACINNLSSIYVLNKFRGISFDKINEASLLVNGYFPYCPSDGKYEYSKERDTIYCTIHGDIESPKQPFKLDKEIPLNRFILGLQHIESSLEFTSEGIMTSVKIERNK